MIVVTNAVVQEGDEPHENPSELLKEAVGALFELEKLVTGINQINLTTKLADGRSLTEAIAQRDTLKSQHALYVAAIAGCKKEPKRYGVSEIKWVATLEVAKLQKQVDDLSKRMRELNALIQQANWGAEFSG